MEQSNVVCAIIINDNKILVAKRNKNVTNTGQWEFPGGKPQKNETLEQCLKRRVFEELNIEIRIVDKFKEYKVESDNKKVHIMHPFVAECITGNPILTNHSCAEWFSIKQLLRLAWPQTDIPIIDEITSRMLINKKIF